LLSATEDEELEDAYTTLVGLSISDTNMQDACNALYAYLNPTGTNDPTMAETIATAVLALRDWLYGENEDPAMLYDLQHDTTIVAATYKAVWSNYYKERTSLLADLGRKALIELQMMGSDNVLTAEEKKTVIREWEKVVAQNAGFVAQLSLSHIDETSGNYDATLQAYDSAYCALYTYLDTLSHTPDQNFNYKSTISSGHPAMLRNGETTEGSATAVSGTFNGAYFTSMWNNYYSAAEALQTALSTTNIQTFVSATLPQPPYKVGDLWVCIPANNASGVYKVYICIVAKAKGATAAQSDWKEYEIPQDPSDPTGLLASIVEKLYTDYKDTDAKWPFTVTLNVTNGNKVTAANAPSTAISGFDATLNLLLAFLGNKVFHVYRSKDISSQQLVEYDLKATPVVFTVPGTQETLEGGIEISMYDGTGWTYLQESTSGLIENLGNMILATVFGINQGTIEASGLSLGQRFAYLFSQATVWDATANNGQGGYVTLTQALFGLSIQQDANGHYYSSAQLRGDKIDFRGKDIILGASDKLNFKGGEINFTAGSDNGESDGNGGTIDNGGIINFSGAKQINLNANEVNLNAEKLTWNGTAQNPRVIIDDGNGNSKFSVDENGNVTMNNFTAMNGNIVGRVKTSDGSCIVESLTPYNNTNYNWKGLAIIRDADAVVDDSTYITTTTQDVATFGVRKYNSSQTMSYIGHANADVSGFEEARVFLLGRDANGNPVGKIEMSGLQPAIAIGSPTNNTIILRGNTGEVACTDLNASGNVEAADIIGSGIIINGSTVTLPSDAKTGTIRIVKATTVNAGLAGSIIMPNSTTAVSSLTLNSKTALFVYDGTYWQVIITDTI